MSSSERHPNTDWETRESYSVTVQILYDDVAQSVRASLPQEVKVSGLNPFIVSISSFNHALVAQKKSGFPL